MSSLALVLALAGPAVAVAPPGVTTRVSVTSAGGQTSPVDLESWGVGSVSADGRYVTFDSDAPQFGGAGSGAWSVMRRDTVDKTTAMVSVSKTGSVADGSSTFPSISGDGRYVAFMSDATNLATGSPAAGKWAVYVRDMQTGVTTLASVNGSGAAIAADCLQPAISADGRHVAFVAQSFVSPDFIETIYVRDLDAGTTAFVASSTNLTADEPSISADGRYVAFESDEPGIVAGDTNEAYDVFVRDLDTSTTVRVSLTNAGSQAVIDPDAGLGSGVPSISADGRKVAFQSDATNLVSGDTNNVNDVFVRDLQANTTTRVSVASDGSQALDPVSSSGSRGPSMSGDGTHVSFTSYAANLVTGDANLQPDIFVRDLAGGTTTLVSATAAGVGGNSLSDGSFLDSDGSVAVFTSYASNLVSSDTNNGWDVFVRDFDTAPPVAVSTTITINRNVSSVRYPTPFQLSGVLTPGSVGDPCVVEVKKPGSARWSYSSARLAYSAAAGGGANWWYRYSPKLRGTYTFRARFVATADRLASLSRTLTVVVK